LLIKFAIISADQVLNRNIQT